MILEHLWPLLFRMFWLDIALIDATRCAHFDSEDGGWIPDCDEYHAGEAGLLEDGE